MAWHDKDKAGKWLLDHHAGALLRLAGLTTARSWQTRAAETVQPSQVPDGLLDVTVAGQDHPVPVLVEVATKPERRLVRQLRRGMQLVFLDRDVLPEVVAIVLQARGRYRVPRAVRFQSPLGLTRMAVDWHVVELWTLRAADLLATGDVGAIPWIPLTQFADSPERLFRDCRQRIERQAPPNQCEQLLAATRIMAGLRYNNPSLLGLLFGSTTMVKWTDFPEIKRALEEADNQGMLRGQHRLLVQVLRARFKRVPKELTRAIEAVTDPAALKELASVAATCPTLAAFRARLPS